VKWLAFNLLSDTLYLLKLNNYFVTIIFDFLNLQRRNRIREVHYCHKVSWPDSLYIVSFVYYNGNTPFWILVFCHVCACCISRSCEIIYVTISFSRLMDSVCRLACCIVCCICRSPSIGENIPIDDILGGFLYGYIFYVISYGEYVFELSDRSCRWMKVEFS